MAYTPLEQFKLDHANTYDEKGNVIQKNGKNVAPTSSPYNPATIKNSINKGNAITASRELLGMGTKAAQPAPTAPTNTISPKFADPTQQAQYDKTLAMFSNKSTPTTPAVAPTAPITPPKATNTNKSTDTPNTNKNSNQGYITQLADQSQKRNLELANQAQKIATQAGQKMSDIGQQGARGAAGYLTTGTSPVGEGNAAVLNQSTAAQQQAVAQGANMQLAGIQQGLSAQGQTQSALGQAAGFTQPTTQFGVLTNPQTGQPISGNIGNAITMGTNITSIQDGQAKINNLDQQAGGAKNNLQLATSIARQLPGMNSNAPIVNTFKQIYGSNFTQSPQYAAFQAQIESIKNAYAAMGIDPGISDWSNISVDQLEYLAKTLEKNVNNTKSGIQQNISQLQSGLGGGGYNSSDPFDW